MALSALSRLEKGERRPRRTTLEKLVRAMRLEGNSRAAELFSAAGRQIEPTAGQPAIIEFKKQTRSGARRPRAVEQEQTATETQRSEESDALGNARSAVRSLLEDLPSLGRDDIEELHAGLDDVIKHSVEQWDGVPAIPGTCLHGTDHHVGMLNQLARWYKPELCALGRVDLRLLILTVFFHDSGLAVEPQGSGILDRYHWLSARHVVENYLVLLLHPNERDDLATLCRYHRAPDLTRIRGSFPDRLLGILALLHLSSLGDVRRARIQDRELRLAEPLPNDSYSELVRNLFVTQIRRDGDTLHADVTCDPEWGQPALQNLMSSMELEMQEVIDGVKEAPIGNARTLPLRVQIRTGPRPTLETAEVLASAWKLIVVSRSPNAGQVSHSVFATWREILEQRDLQAISEKLNAERKMFTSRHYAQLANLDDDLDAILQSGRDDKLSKMTKVVADYDARKKEAYARIATEARKLFQPKPNLILFGYSDCVLHALTAMSAAVAESARVVVLECRNKSRYKANGSIAYSDGLAYFEQVKALGYKDVTLASDGSAAAAIEEERENPTYVLLGTHGIDPTGDVTCTVGTRTIALVAKGLREEHDGSPPIDVYILAEGGKVRDPIDWGGQRENWFTNDDFTAPRSESRQPDHDRFALVSAQRVSHEASGASSQGSDVSFYTPRNERVSASLISRFITERGVLRTTDIRMMYPHGGRSPKGLLVGKSSTIPESLVDS